MRSRVAQAEDLDAGRVVALEWKVSAFGGCLAALCELAQSAGVTL